MIVTITPNTCLDRTLVVPEFSLHKTIRATRLAVGMGGKAADASWILGEYGISSLALGFSAGASGRQMEQMLWDRNVQTDFTTVDGETRVNTILVMEDGSGQSTFSVSTLKVSAAHIQDLQQKYTRALRHAECVVIGGSLPDDVPGNLFDSFITQAHGQGIPVIFDASGPAFRSGLVGRPTLVKPNRDELEEFSGRPLQALDDIYRAGREMFEKWGCSVIVTLGGEGTLAILPDRAYWIPPLPVQVISTAGAGDGMLAGLAAAAAAGNSLEDGLRLGTAMAGAVCLQLATADCRKADIDALLPAVRLVPYIS